MEDIKKRLEFGNTSIQIQAIGRLYEQVVGKKKDEAPLTAASPQMPEMKQLLECCGDEDVVLATSASEAVVTLVRRGQAEFGYLLNSLLNVVPSAKSLVGICNAVTNLLVMQLATALDEDQTDYKSPYGIRTPPHPFVTILTNRPESWPVLVHQVKRILGWQDPRVLRNSLVLLRPFLTFVLLEPPQSPQFMPLRLVLPTAIIDAAENKVTKEAVIRFLQGIVPCLQVRSAGQFGEVTCLLEQLVALILESIQRGLEVKPGTLSTLMVQCMALCLEAQGLALDIGPLLHLVETTVTKQPVMCRSERLWLLVCHQLPLTPVYQLNHLLVLAIRLIGKSCDFPRHLVAMMIMPALSVLTMPPSVGDEKHSAQTLVAHLLQAIERYSERNEVVKDMPQRNVNTEVGFINEEGVLHVYVKLSREFDINPMASCDWLLNIQASLPEASQVPDYVTYLVAAISVLTSDQRIIQVALDVLSNVAKKECTQVPNMLPLLMFCVGCHGDPENKLLFLNAMPNVAANKVAIAPTLKTLQQLGTNDGLKPLVFRLVTSLWKQQDRCFPYLQKMLQAAGLGSLSVDTHINEVLLAKAACIKEICQVRPHQHGADMLAPLSAILDQCTLVEDAVPASLALEGLGLLCEAEVVDIRTAWTVLDAKLSKDQRPEVVQGVCKLFSLVPGLAVNTPAYEEFMEKVVSMLWGYSQHPNSTIAGAAYTALAAFSGHKFRLDLLPNSVTDDIRQEAVAKAEADRDPEPAMPETPGVCFVRLLEQTPDEVIPAFGSFLKSLVREEVVNIPRGVYHASFTRQTTSAQNKTISAIPEFLYSCYEKNKQPGLRSSLAAGLLFSYDPPVAVGRDGKVRRMGLVNHGRAYHQMFYTLLHEVSMQPSDWHRCLATPAAWVSFMGRCYLAYIESRKAELSLALDQGQVKDPTENQLHTDTAWLWCRDKLVDLIKSASRGGPSIQANCVSALAGLALAATKYASGLDEVATAAAEEATEYLGHSHWLSIVTNTVMAILDPTFVPAGRIFTMCQQRAGQPLSSASVLARGGACLALPLLVPVLVTVNTDIIYQMIDSVMAQLPGQPRCDDDSPTLQFFHGLGLGMLLARLFEEHFVDVSGTQGEVAVWKGVHALEATSLSSGDNRLGCLLGLALCAASMCSDGKLDTRAHVFSLQEQLAVALETMDARDPSYQGICICVGSTMVSAYAGGFISMDVVNQFVARVYEAHARDVKDGGVAAALGGMCDGLLRAGHPTVTDLARRLAATWTHGLAAQDVQMLERLACLEGIMSLAGADHSLFRVAQSSGEQQCALSPSSAVKVVQELLSGGKDLGLQTSCSWRLGQLYLASSGANTHQSSVPSTYSYLPDTSLLKPITNTLLEAGKTGTMSAVQVALLLGSLADGATKPLPPLNWAGLLSPIMRLSLDAEVQSRCVRLTVHQGAASPSASLFVTSWLLSPLWDSLQDNTRQLVVDSLPVLIKAVPVPKLREFLGKGFMTVFDEDKLDLQTHSLRGLAAALRVPDPPQSVTLALYQTVERLYPLLPPKSDLYAPLCECLHEVPDQIVDLITKDDFSKGADFVKAMYVRCHLVSHGNQPMAWLNGAVEAALWQVDEALSCGRKSSDISLELLLCCFNGCLKEQSGKSGPTKLSQWLLELMGYIKNVATGTMSPPNGATVTTKTIEFLMCVFAAAVVSWSGLHNNILLGKKSMTGHVVARGQSGELADSLLTLLPSAVVKLLTVAPWKQLTSMVLDWMMDLHEACHVKDLHDVQGVILGCIYGLKHTVGFRKMATWSTAYLL